MLILDKQTHTDTMSLLFPTVFLFLFLLLLSLTSSYVSASPASGYTSQDFVRSSCSSATYPTICLRTLSSYSGPANSPNDLAQAAVKVSLRRATRASSFLKNQTSSGIPIGKRQRGALSDCIELVADSLDELSRTLDELQHLRGAKFRWHLSNAQTWASAALTDDDTCIDGFDEAGGAGELKYEVWRRVRNVARVTSNALYMINRLGGKHS